VRPGLADGCVFRALRRGNHLTTSSEMSADAIADVVFAHAAPLELDVAAHDCRRMFAKLALKGGARLEQIQLSLGHQSIQTSQRYLGVELDLRDALCDHLGLRMPESWTTSRRGLREDELRESLPSLADTVSMTVRPVCQQTVCAAYASKSPRRPWSPPLPMSSVPN
jgi:hypothetical protein